MKKYSIRHGEVFLTPVDGEVKGKVSKHKSYIVGHSETGHHHVLQSNTEYDVIENDDELYIRLFKPGKLVHQKTVNRHNDLTVPTGTYKITRKQEYDPFQKVMRAVWD